MTVGRHCRMTMIFQQVSFCGPRVRTLSLFRRALPSFVVCRLLIVRANTAVTLALQVATPESLMVRLLP